MITPAYLKATCLSDQENARVCQSGLACRALLVVQDCLVKTMLAMSALPALHRDHFLPGQCARDLIHVHLQSLSIT